MKTINVYLETKDFDYSTALAKSLQQHSKYFSIQIGKQEKESKDWDIYLTDDMNAFEQKIVYLTEDPKLATVNEENSCYILHKYQHVGHISNILRLAHSDYSQSELLSDETEHTNIISICASCGGAGCTSIALGICQELTRFHGKKVLYISLEEFVTTTNNFQDAYPVSNNIAKYVYSILNKRNCCTYAPAGYMMKDDYGIFAFYPTRGRNPLCELSRNEFIQFINHITSEKLFTDLVLDCGNGLGDAVVSALQLSAHIFHISGKRPDAHRRANYLSTVGNRMAIEDSTGIHEVLNFFVTPEPEDGEPLIETKIQLLTIEEDPTSFEVVNGRKVVSLDKMFGQGIRDLTQHLMLPGD